MERKNFKLQGRIVDSATGTGLPDPRMELTDNVAGPPAPGSTTLLVVPFTSS